MNSKAFKNFTTIPNLLSLFRILLIPLFIRMVIHHNAYGALAVFLAAAATDALDGMAARIWRQSTKLGTILDPAGDKLLMTTCFIVLSLPAFSSPNVIPLWLTISVIGRDVLIVTGVFIIYKLKGSSLFPPSLIGKASTIFQMSVLVAVLYFNVTRMSPPYMKILYELTLLMTLLSGIQYILRGVRILASRNS